jgi:hypothetical protein
MKKFHVHTYINEAEVQARLNGQLYRNIRFKNQYILF